MSNLWYKNIQLGDIKSVNLDLNNTDIIDLKSGDQFIKTCSSNQSFIIFNPQQKNFRLLLTGGSINSTPFRISNKNNYEKKNFGNSVKYFNKLFNNIHNNINIRIKIWENIKQYISKYRIY
jgi:hypothetical protein